MLDNSSQLLTRHAIGGQDLLVVNAMDAYPREQGAHSHFFHYGHFRQFGDERARFSAVIDSRAREVVLYVPKEKALAHMLLDNLASCLQPDDTLYLVGDNRGGIKALAKQLPAPWGPAQKIASGNHCLLYRTQLAQSAPPFSIDTYRTQFALDSDALTVVNLPGVFSHQRLDAGTELLLQSLPAGISGKVLDFACGSGVIGAAVQHRFALTSLTCSDVSAFALRASELTLQANQQTGDVIASNGLQHVDGKFDWIISNPPFHTGKKTDYEIARQFFAAAPQHLKPGGRLLIVANSFLPYPELLRQSFSQVTEHTNNGRFRVLEAV
ncbi:methyltransferase [Aliidiomarina sp. Khilg15.8]